MNQSIAFLKSIHEVWERPVPADVMDRARQSLLDYLAVTCAGAAFQKDKVEAYLDFAQPEEGAFRAIGTGKDLALKEAVFLNGLNGHALDFDDGTNAGIIHLGSPVFSLLLPLAQRYGKSVEEVLRAAVIGYETSYTLAISIQPGHKALGYHATGTCGTIGAAVAAGYLLESTGEERFRIFAAASVAASGMLKALDDESELKPYNVAKAGLLALTALQMGKSGFTGSTDPLGGRGFLKMMTGKDDVVLEPVLKNGTYAIQKTYTKPYASCRYTHPAVEAAVRLREQVDPAAIDEVLVKTYDLAVAGHDHTDIKGSYSAKMSIPYAVAAGFLYGKAGLSEFSEETVLGGEILALTKKIRIEADEAFSAVFPKEQGALVIVKTGADELREQVDYPKGEPENPLSPEEFRERYDDLMAYAGVGSEVSGEIFEKAMAKGALADELVKDL